MRTLYQIYHDEVPALLRELCATGAMQRLRCVGMNCGCEYTGFRLFEGGKRYSRYEHSLGVGLIVWHFTGDPAQAAAGLLHDVATPVFAHVIDFLHGDHLTQESTEDGTRRRIEDDPELRAVLRRYGLTVDDVADYHRYPVADNDSPRLSADRLEYTLGNALEYGFLTREEIGAIYGDLTVLPNEAGVPELQFRSREAARTFARVALKNARVYVSPEDRYCMQALSELIGRAVNTGVLEEAELWTMEPAVISRLLSSPLAGKWQAFRALNAIRTAPGETPPDARPWRVIPAKKRRIDPLLAWEGRVSALDPAFAADLAAFLAEPQTDWVLAEAL